MTPEFPILQSTARLWWLREKWFLVSYWVMSLLLWQPQKLIVLILKKKSRMYRLMTGFVSDGAFNWFQHNIDCLLVNQLIIRNTVKANHIYDQHLSRPLSKLISIIIFRPVLIWCCYFMRLASDINCPVVSCPLKWRCVTGFFYSISGLYESSAYTANTSKQSSRFL